MNRETTDNRIVYARTRKVDNDDRDTEGAFHKPTSIKYVKYALGLLRKNGTTGVS